MVIVDKLNCFNLKIYKEQIQNVKSNKEKRGDGEKKVDGGRVIIAVFTARTARDAKNKKN